MSKVGVQQGDPLGPLLFSLAIQPLVAVRWWLGLPIYEGTLKCKGCNKEMDEMGDHAQGCRQALHSRHNAVRDCFHRHCTWGGISSRKEVLGLLPGSNERPADVFLPSGVASGRPTAIDFTVVHPRAKSNVKEAAKIQGVTAMAAEAEKSRNYAGRLEESNMNFWPFGLETFGGFSDRSQNIVRRVARAVAQRSHSDRVEVLRRMIDETSVCLIRDIASSLCGRGDLIRKDPPDPPGGGEAKAQSTGSEEEADEQTDEDDNNDRNPYGVIYNYVAGGSLELVAEELWQGGGCRRRIPDVLAEATATLQRAEATANKEQQSPMVSPGRMEVEEAGGWVAEVQALEDLSIKFEAASIKEGQPKQRVWAASSPPASPFATPGVVAPRYGNSPQVQLQDLRRELGTVYADGQSAPTDPVVTGRAMEPPQAVVLVDPSNPRCPPPAPTIRAPERPFVVVRAPKTPQPTSTPPVWSEAARTQRDKLEVVRPLCPSRPLPLTPDPTPQGVAERAGTPTTHTPTTSFRQLDFDTPIGDAADPTETAVDPWREEGFKSRKLQTSGFKLEVHYVWGCGARGWATFGMRGGEVTYPQVVLFAEAWYRTSACPCCESVGCVAAVSDPPQVRLGGQMVKDLREFLWQGDLKLQENRPHPLDNDVYEVRAKVSTYAKRFMLRAGPEADQAKVEKRVGDKLRSQGLILQAGAFDHVKVVDASGAEETLTAFLERFSDFGATTVHPQKLQQVGAVETFDAGSPEAAASAKRSASRADKQNTRVLNRRGNITVTWCGSEGTLHTELPMRMSASREHVCAEARRLFEKRVAGATVLEENLWVETFGPGGVKAWASCGDKAQFARLTGIPLPRGARKQRR